MREYPSIPGPSKAPHKPCIAFVKYDGSNLRAEWTRKRGFSKFGTRDRRFDETDPDFGGAIKVFQRDVAEAVERVLTDHKRYRNEPRVTAYFEYLGPKSFAGVHKANGPTDPMQCVLLDIALDKAGLVGPRDFVRDFGGVVHRAQVVYEGNMNASLIQDVREGKYPVCEGVVCKGGSGGDDWWACKIKTNAYMERLKAVFGGEWERFWE